MGRDDGACVFQSRMALRVAYDSGNVFFYMQLIVDWCLIVIKKIDMVELFFYRMT